MHFRLVVAGCRDFNDYSLLSINLDQFIVDHIGEKSLIIVSGGSEGADKLGERYALEHGYAIEKYPAEWSKYGKFAGPKRNEQMAKVSDYVIVFWDGISRGTQSMIKCACKYNKPCRIININK